MSFERGKNWNFLAYLCQEHQGFNFIFKTYGPILMARSDIVMLFNNVTRVTMCCLLVPILDPPDKMAVMTKGNHVSHFDLPRQGK